MVVCAKAGGKGFSWINTEEHIDLSEAMLSPLYYPIVRLATLGIGE